MPDPMTPERLAEIEQRFASGRVVNVVTQRALLVEVQRLQAAVERVRDRQGVPMTLPELAAIRAIVAVAHPHHHLLTAIDAAMDVARDRSVTTEEVNDD